MCSIPLLLSHTMPICTFSQQTCSHHAHSDLLLLVHIIYIYRAILLLFFCNNTCTTTCHVTIVRVHCLETYLLVAMKDKVQLLLLLLMSFSFALWIAILTREIGRQPTCLVRDKIGLEEQVSIVISSERITSFSSRKERSSPIVYCNSRNQLDSSNMSLESNSRFRFKSKLSSFNIKLKWLVSSSSLGDARLTSEFLDIRTSLLVVFSCYFLSCQKF